MQPRTHRAYALAVPDRRLPEETTSALYMDICTVHGGATVERHSVTAARTSSSDAADISRTHSHISHTPRPS